MFDVDPSQIETLDAMGLVALLRRLLQSEALSVGVPLSGVAVPLQITVADGGEDGRIEWEGGLASTDFLPGRINFFQCKASNLNRSGWMKECWEKSTTKRGATRRLSSALDALISNGGFYVGFTTQALGTLKRDEFIAGIREAITEAGGDWKKLGGIKLYDANAIASWATLHPSVALWLAELAQRQSLAGYRSLDAWGKRADFVANAYVDDGAERYAIGRETALGPSGAGNKTTAKVAAQRIVTHLLAPGGMVRVAGTSGLGKSRFIYEALQSSAWEIATIVGSSTVVADYRTVSSNLLSVAHHLADSNRRTLLVVDECPRDIAMELGKLAGQAGSQLSIVTIDTDDRPLEEKASLHVAVSPADAELISQIIRQGNPDLDDHAVERLQTICGGYPRFAVLVAGAGELAATRFETADDVVDRILGGAGLKAPEELRALQCLSLFESLAAEEPPELDFVADKFARMSGDEMYEHLVKAQRCEVVGQSRLRLSAQPLPVAIVLANRRVELMRPASIVQFVKAASEPLAISLLHRCRYLDRSPVVAEAAKRLLHDRDQLGSADATLSSRGSAMVDALVHIVPDHVASHLEHYVLPLDLPELRAAGEGRRAIVEAAAKLVFRSRSFTVGARLLMRLGAAENETWANNATALFKQLYHLQLSGTEASPDERFMILDEGLESPAAEIRALCVEALGSVFSSDFIRFGDTGSIGSNELVDWRPRTTDQVDAFYRGGLTRLAQIRIQRPELASRCEDLLANAARRMLSTRIYQEYGATVSEIAREKGSWPEAVDGIGDWLYFDRKGASKKHAEYVRALYGELFPAELIEKAIVYTQFWPADIRSPDAVYADGDRDFEYSAREAGRVAGQIAEDAASTILAVQRMAAMDLKNVHPFAVELARLAVNRVEAYRIALHAVAGGGNMQMLRGLLRGIDLVDAGLADECLREGLRALAGKRSPIELYTALSIDKPRLRQVLDELKSGSLPPQDCAHLSYGRALDQLQPEDVAQLIRALAQCGTVGAWTALEVALMYKYGEPMPPEHAQEIAGLLTLPSLFADGRDHRRDADVIESLVDRVRNKIGIDEDLATGLAKQVVRSAQLSDYGTFDNLKDSVRHIIQVLVEDRPATIWAEVASFFEIATPIERGRLEQLIGADSDRFDRVNHTGPGPLFGVPEAAVLDWASKSEDRLPLLLEFYPTLATEDGPPRWHPALIVLAETHGASKAFTEALADRIRPSSWSGSIVPLLEVYLEPLASWHDHGIPSLARWAREMSKRLDAQIERSKEREAAELDDWD